MKKFYVIIVGVLIALFFPIGVSAEGFTISVTPEIPENQQGTSQNMYNLKMAPNEEKAYRLYVTNKGEHDKEVAIMITDATTLSDGTIDASNPKVKLIKQAKNKLSDLVTLKQDKLVIPANKTKEVVFSIKTPKKEMPGVILGAIYVLDKNEGTQKETSQTTGMSLHNQMGYTTEIMLSLSDKQVKAELALDKVIVGTYKGHPSLEIPIQNLNPNIVPDVTVKTEIKEVGSAQVSVTDTKKDNQLAPQAFFPHQVQLAESKIKKGHYTARIKASSEYGQWEWQREFEITSGQAKDLNQRTTQGGQHLPLWVYLLASLGLALILLISFLIYQVSKKQH